MTMIKYSNDEITLAIMGPCGLVLLCLVPALFFDYLVSNRPLVDVYDAFALPKLIQEIES